MTDLLKPLVLLVHGFNVEDQQHTVGRLAPMFERLGFDVATFEYDNATLLDVRFASDNLSAALLSTIRIAGAHRLAVIPIGHSNGCALIHQAAKRNEAAWMRGVDPPHIRTIPWWRSVYLSPALDRDAPLPEHDKPGVHQWPARVDVCHTRHDRAVWWSRWLAFHPWGDMGRVGATAEDLRYVNHDGTAVSAGHSGWFEPAGLEWLIGRIAIPLAISCDLL